MNERITRLPKYVSMFIIVILIGVVISGYVLYYYTQQKLIAKEAEYQNLKEKFMHVDENFKDVQNKYSNQAAEEGRLNKEYQAVLEKQQDCMAKQEALQNKYDELVKQSETLKNEKSPTTDKPTIEKK